MPKKENKSEQKKWYLPFIGIAIAAAILLTIANSAVWINRYIFDTENFTQVATSSLTSESSRQAIAQRVTNRVLGDRPVAQNLIGDRATSIVSGVLGTSQFESATDNVISRLHVVLTSESKENVVINLQGVKDLLNRIVDAIDDKREVKVDSNNIPSEIVLLDRSNIPNFYTYGVVFLWLGPIAFIAAVILLIYPYYKRRKNYSEIALIQGVTLIIVGLLSLLIGPLFRPPLLANIPDSQARIVVGNLYNDFIATFNSQTIIIIVLGLFFCTASLVLFVLSNRKKLR